MGVDITMWMSVWLGVDYDGTSSTSEASVTIRAGIRERCIYLLGESCRERGLPIAARHQRIGSRADRRTTRAAPQGLDVESQPSWPCRRSGRTPIRSSTTWSPTVAS